LVVKWADTEKERQARKAQKAQFQPSNLSNANAMQQSSLFGALQMGYVPPYNGFGYQVNLNVKILSLLCPYNKKLFSYNSITLAILSNK
jgi:hypothetical protein